MNAIAVTILLVIMNQTPCNGPRSNGKLSVRSYSFQIEMESEIHSSRVSVVPICTQRNLFEILSNQTEIRLYSPFSDWFWSKWMSVWIQINLKMVNTIWFWVDSIKFWKDFSVCRNHGLMMQPDHSYNPITHITGRFSNFINFHGTQTYDVFFSPPKIVA